MSEPSRGRRKWKGKGKRDAQKATYANRRRIRGNRGKPLLRQRGERVERAFAHMLETGSLRRVPVRGQENIRKRMLVHAVAFNLRLLMRKRFGLGTPHSLQDLTAAKAVLAAQATTAHSPLFRDLRSFFAILAAVLTFQDSHGGRSRQKCRFPLNPTPLPRIRQPVPRVGCYPLLSTGFWGDGETNKQRFGLGSSLILDLARSFD